ncbi:MAG TPA: FIST N-terminal domain-containing protein [Baekduia sp.]|nr:FIST N-terminal domain-containing protein [Baekduia sp.]
MTTDMERAEAGLERARRCRWADVGRSAHPDAATAGREAARSALASSDDDARLLLVFASSDYDLHRLTAAIGDVAAGVPVVGCSSAGEISESGPAHGSVLVIALGGDGFTFSATAVSASADPRDAGARAAACVGDVADREHRVLLLLSDGPTSRQPDVVRGAYSVAGAGVPLVGGLAGRRARPARPSLIFGGAVLEDAVIGIAIGSDAPLGVGVRHGWRPVGEPMLVTRATPERVMELDGRPAAEVYRERLGGRQAVDMTLAHPLGMQRRVGEAHVRWVADDGAQDGSLDACVAAGAMVWLMESDADGVKDATDAACREALDGLGGEPALALLAFDCNARLLFLGDGVGDEVARLARHADGAALAGLYTFGEIARTRGSAGFHEQTLVVLALA